ncbi:hypothetical protein AMTR_s00002p00256200 [Amborella trichopoda]|uniref:UDP-glycosyltransferases domain-containing protein n=1 Tax=Amborella trichopoda TaxID=13333 RepID=W1P070_AMBTC|nr:hypothetical protein AMTR_s00002p00256200 [Amborella trichopoda]
MFRLYLNLQQIKKNTSTTFLVSLRLGYWNFQTCSREGSPHEIAESLNVFHQVQNAKSIIVSSFYELESSEIDALSSLVPRPIFHVGPLMPFPPPKDHEFKTNARPELDCSSWLDLQPRGFTLYASLGSVMLVPAKQMEELAHGLIESKTRFIWVARDPSTNLRDICTDRGLVVPWCSQSKVLRHPSVGGFLTHCGWLYIGRCIDWCTNVNFPD